MSMQPITPQRSRPGGFSLIELLMVLLILCVVSAMMYNFGSARRQRTQKSLCQDNLLKLYISLQIYAKDFRDQLPVVPNAVTAEEPLAALVPRYTADNSLFICPGGRDSALPSGLPLTQGKISYAYYMGLRLDSQPATPQVLLSDRQVNTNSKPVNAPVFSTDGKSPGNNHHKFGGNFLLSDGSAQDSPPSAAISLVVNPGVVLLNPKP